MPTKKKKSYKITERSYNPDADRYYLKRTIEDQQDYTWDLKFTRTHRLPFSCLKPHQEKFLLESRRGFSYHPTDIGLLKRPFDGMAFCNATPLLVAIYYQPRKAEFYEIRLEDFIREKYSSKEKSLTKERAKEIGTQIFL